MKSDGTLERELIARIQRGDAIADSRKWFLQELSETDFKLGGTRSLVVYRKG